MENECRVIKLEPRNYDIIEAAPIIKRFQVKENRDQMMPLLPRGLS